jgi:GNAT superfamily N-acetyltransferase
VHNAIIANIDAFIVTGLTLFRSRGGFLQGRYGHANAHDRMEYTLSLSDAPDEDARNAIVGPLIEFNASAAGPNNHRPIAIFVRNSEENIVGGLLGHTGYGWLFTQMLVVPASLRRRGVGTEIMQHAEKEAVTRRCHSAWLDTFEFQARGFYERLGYKCFGELPNYPGDNSRFFMKKSLVNKTESDRF